MGLRKLLAATAVRRAHVLLLELPGGGRERIAAERELGRRGWVLAVSPNDADALLTCGPAPDPAEFGDLLDRLWDQLPGPRARSHVHVGDDPAVALDGCAEELLDVDLQTGREEARQVPGENDPDDGVDHEHGGAAGDERDAMDHSEHGAGDADGDDGGGAGEDQEHMDMGGMDMGEMDMGNMDMDMPMPGGIPLAGGGPDRDGLEMDVLRVPLGPLLPLWPAGLVVECSLQGDLVVEATARFLGASDSGTSRHRNRPPTAHDVVVHQTDLAARLLGLAGADPAAARARAIRDAAADGASPRTCHGLLVDELARLRRSVLLRRSLRGVGVIEGDEPTAALAHHEAGDPAGTDAWSRLLGMLETAATAIATGEVPVATAGGISSTGASREDQLVLLSALLPGCDLAEARLIVASLDLDPLRVPAPDRVTA
ncbi:hypothetical protein BKD30_12555 [Tersicoccus phoenicis]|uniref:Uncharacterized protein n=1 Tax=Tersicoccus phoenicis TaxID=554083 RepID=A0A1R1L7C1_9MICC|nr:hypothetical protein [Tersicoccus phoenicis]OMH23450.1 hypothetical protein BKD30_12555 [Tersicoccus phoenicis]